MKRNELNLSLILKKMKFLSKDQSGKVIMKDELGWTPVCYYIQAGNKEAVNQLISKNHAIDDIEININAGTDQLPKKASPLILAVMNGNVEITKLLLENKVDVNRKSDGMSAFMYAAQNDKASDLMDFLIKNGAKAIEGNFKPHIVYVHHEKLNISKESKDQVVKTLLDYAFDHLDQVEMMDCIVNFVKDVRVKEEDKYKENLYQKAKELENEDLMSRLENNGYDKEKGVKKIVFEDNSIIQDYVNNFETKNLENELEKITIGNIEEDN